MSTTHQLMTAKQERELAQAKLLQARCPILLERTLVPLSPPEPDIGAADAEAIIGIEITEIHGNPRLRMTEAEQDRIARSAGEQWRARSLPPVGVIVHWRPTRVGTKYDPSLSERLVALVASKVQPHFQFLRIPEAELLDLLGGNGPIQALSVYASDTGVTEWGSDRQWQASQPAMAFFQAEIDRKREKPAYYRRRYEERWLLLVREGGSPSSGFDLPQQLESATFTSPFDRIFLLDLTPYTLRELRVQRIGSVALDI